MQIIIVPCTSPTIPRYVYLRHGQHEDTRVDRRTPETASMSELLPASKKIYISHGSLFVGQTHPIGLR